MKKRLVQRTAAGFLAGLMLILASGCAGNSSPAGSSGTDTSSEAGSSEEEKVRTAMSILPVGLW